MKLSDYYPDMQDWTRVDQAISASPQIPNPETQVSPYLRAPLPLPLQYSPDTLKQSNRPGMSNFRIAPLPPSGIPAINSASAGVTKVIQSLPGGNVELQTNGIDNADQNKLDIIAGTGVTAVSDVNGGVTLSATGTGDGLLHGTTPWESDPSFMIFRDDFMYGNTSNGTIGETRWTISSTGAVLKTYIGGFNNPGVLQMFTTTTTSSLPGTPGSAGGTGQAVAIFPFTPSFPNSFWDTTWPILDYPGWKMSWVFAISRAYNPAYGGTNSGMPAFTLTKQSMYIGLGNDSTSGTGPFLNSIRPPVFFGCRFDTDTTSPSIGDTTFWLEACMNPPTNVVARNNIQGTGGGAFNTGITPVEGVFYRLDMVYAASGQLQMTLSGNGSTATTTFTLTQMSQLYKSSGNVPVNSNGITNVNLANPNTFSTTTGYVPQGPGSKLTMSGWTSTDTPLNGTFTLLQTQSAIQTIFTPVGFTTPVSQATVTIVGYPSLIPIAIMGNSTEASQAAVNTRALNVDFVSFISNGGLRGATTTNPLNSRYFN